MTLIYGGLNGAIEDRARNGAKIGVVIIDEQSSGEFKETRDQQDVIAVAQGVGAAIYFVELNPLKGSQPNIPTRKALSKGLFTEPIIVTKTSLNAFASTNLLGLLREKKITSVIAMGFRTNCCVKLTVVGGHEGPPHNPGPRISGALDYGFEVMSCAAIVRDDSPADWSHLPGVSFYSRVF